MGLFNKFFKKIIMSSMKEQFLIFLNNIEESSKETLNRTARRNSKNNLNRLFGPIELPNDIKNAFKKENSIPLKFDNQYQHFLSILLHFYNNYNVNDSLLSETFIEPLISIAKQNNCTARFISYFDNETLKPKLDTILELNSYVESICSSYKMIYSDTNCDKFINSIVPRDLVLEVEGKRNTERSRKAEEKFRKSIEKRKEKHTSEINELIKKDIEPTSKPIKKVVIETKEKKAPLTTEERIMKLYESDKLPQQFEEFGPDMIESVLRSNNISKQERIKVVEEYKKIKRTIRIETVVGQEKLKRILTQIDLNEYENFRSSSYVDSLSDEEIRSAITSMPVVPSDPNKVRKKRH